MLGPILAMHSAKLGMTMKTSKNPHAVALGRKGGKATSDAKKAASRANVAKARKAKFLKTLPTHSQPECTPDS